MNQSDICPYCGENKWNDVPKHMAELAAFLQEKVRECQEIVERVNKQ